MATSLRLLIMALAALPVSTVSFAADKDGFADTFAVDRQDLASVGGNDYFSLRPGNQLILEGTDEGKVTRLAITVLNETKVVDGVETRVVEERESIDGQLIEVSRNFFAVDKKSGDVYYFGEDVDIYTDGKLTGHVGAWQSSRDGARFGLFMPANPQLGQKFYQEVAPGVAMDRCEIVSLAEKHTVPAGAFEKVVKVRETTPLEPGVAEHKVYAPKVGLLGEQELKLVKYGPIENQR